MSLGTNLYFFRTKAGLSQDALAEKLDVSRQSVSKWETDASVPELDKLIKLSELFGISLDELILNKKAEPPLPAPVPSSAAPAPVQVPEPCWIGRRVAGAILLTLGGVVLVALTLLAGLAGPIMALPFLICGILCFKCPKRPGLWCAWTVVLWISCYLVFSTGLNVGYALSWLFTPKLREIMNGDIRMVIASSVMLAIYAAMTGWTLWDFRKNPLRRTPWTILLAAALWLACFVALPRLARSLVTTMANQIMDGHRYARLSRLIRVLNLAYLPIVVAAITVTVALLRKQNRPADDFE